MGPVGVHGRKGLGRRARRLLEAPYFWEVIAQPPVLSRPAFRYTARDIRFPIWCFSALTGPHDLVLLVIYAKAGVGFGMRISLLTTIPADLFAGRSFGAILGFTNGGGGLGGFIGPFLAGYLFDRTGTISWRSR